MEKTPLQWLEWLDGQSQPIPRLPERLGKLHHVNEMPKSVADMARVRDSLLQEFYRIRKSFWNDGDLFTYYMEHNGNEATINPNRGRMFNREIGVPKSQYEDFCEYLSAMIDTTMEYIKKLGMNPDTYKQELRDLFGAEQFETARNIITVTVDTRLATKEMLGILHNERLNDLPGMRTFKENYKLSFGSIADDK